MSTKPLVVLVAGESVESIPGADELQEKLANVSSNSMPRIVAGATHMSLVANQAHAQVVANATRQVVEAVRADHPLSRW